MKTGDESPERDQRQPSLDSADESHRVKTESVLRATHYHNKPASA